MTERVGLKDQKKLSGASSAHRLSKADEGSVGSTTKTSRRKGTTSEEKEKKRVRSGRKRCSGSFAKGQKVEEKPRGVGRSHATQRSV